MKVRIIGRTTFLPIRSRYTVEATGVKQTYFDVVGRRSATMNITRQLVR